jgi:hypothetical protein
MVQADPVLKYSVDGMATVLEVPARERLAAVVSSEAVAEAVGDCSGELQPESKTKRAKAVQGRDRTPFIDTPHSSYFKCIQTDR